MEQDSMYCNICGSIKAQPPPVLKVGTLRFAPRHVAAEMAGRLQHSMRNGKKNVPGKLVDLFLDSFSKENGDIINKTIRNL